MCLSRKLKKAVSFSTARLSQFDPATPLPVADPLFYLFPWGFIQVDELYAHAGLLLDERVVLPYPDDNRPAFYLAALFFVELEGYLELLGPLPRVHGGDVHPSPAFVIGVPEENAPAVSS